MSEEEVSQTQGPARTIPISPTIPITVTPLAKRIIVWCLSFTAFVLSCVAVGSCKFVQLTQSTDAGVTIQYFGLFQFLSGGTCVSMDLIIDDALISLSSSDEAARAFGVLASLLGGVAMLAFLSVFCMNIDQKKWRAIGIALVVCFVFQSFTFIIFNSPRCKDDTVTTKCNLDEGGAASISAMLFYMFAAVGVFLLPVPSEDIILDFTGESSSSPDKQKTVTEVINSDGSKTVFVTETINPIAPPTEEVGNDSAPHSDSQTDEENPPDNEDTKETTEAEAEKFDNEDLEDTPAVYVPKKEDELSKRRVSEASEHFIDANATEEDKDVQSEAV